jgi:hypothetical protein
MGAISWDAHDGVLWACAIDPPPNSPNLSQRVVTVRFDPKTGVGTWKLAGRAPHGCVNNVDYRAGLVYADGAYTGSSGSSTHVDRSAVLSNLQLRFADSRMTLFSPHVSGTIVAADGSLEWQADNYGTVKSIWHAGKRIEWGSLRFEQLACDEASGTVYIKWFNENRFGRIDSVGC